MTNEPDDLLPVLDTPPKGKVRHLEDYPPTAEEIEAGQRLGRQIDIDDDNDNGLDR